MTLSFNIPQSQVAALESALAARMERVRKPVQAAMADTFYNVVMANFGSTGWDRPWGWMELSDTPSGMRYRRKVGRDFATLVVTGALKNSVKKSASGNVASVSMSNADVPYALAHHHGSPGNFGFVVRGFGELPARRVFPLDNFGGVTPKTVRVVMQAASGALKGALR